MRGFIGIAIPASVGKEMAAHQTQLAKHLELGNVRWVQENQLHITLQFLGNINEAIVSSLVEGLRATVKSYQPLQIAFDEICWFPSEQKPHMLVLKVSPTLMLAELAGSVKQVVEDLGLLTDSKLFVPHVTLARLRDQKAFQLDVSSSVSSFIASEIALYKSDVDHTGGYYSVLDVIVL